MRSPSRNFVASNTAPALKMRVAGSPFSPQATRPKNLVTFSRDGNLRARRDSTLRQDIAPSMKVATGLYSPSAGEFRRRTPWPAEGPVLSGEPRKGKARLEAALHGLSQEQCQKPGALPSGSRCAFSDCLDRLSRSSKRRTHSFEMRPQSC